MKLSKNAPMRYEFRFSPIVVNNARGKIESIEYRDTIPKYWQYSAYMIIDHWENKIIKNRYGVT